MKQEIEHILKEIRESEARGQEIRDKLGKFTKYSGGILNKRYQFRVTSVGQIELNDISPKRFDVWPQSVTLDKTGAEDLFVFLKTVLK